MPSRSVTRGMRAALSGLIFALAATVAALPAASPVFAAGDPCCLVSIDNLPGQFPAGGSSQPFTLRVVNQTRDPLRSLTVSFVLEADGLVGDLVHLQRLRAAGGPHNVGTFTERGVHSGAVTASEQIDLATLAPPPGGGLNLQYQLLFNRKLPGGRLELSVRVESKRGHGSAGSAGPYLSTIVAAGQPTAQPDPAPTATAPDSPAPSAATGIPAGPTGLAAPGGGRPPGGGGSWAWLAYTIGTLLLLGGVGLLGTLLARRAPAGTDGDEPARTPAHDAAHGDR
jgi:hypothetical protein